MFSIPSRGSIVGQIEFFSLDKVSIMEEKLFSN